MDTSQHASNTIGSAGFDTAISRPDLQRFGDVIRFTEVNRHQTRDSASSSWALPTRSPTAAGSNRS